MWTSGIWMTTFEPVLTQGSPYASSRPSTWNDTIQAENSIRTVLTSEERRKRQQELAAARAAAARDRKSGGGEGGSSR